MKKALFALSVLAVFSMVGCAATVKQVAATDAEGDGYPFCVKVVQPIIPLKARLKVLGCATTETAAEEQKAQLQTLYPQATLAVVRGR